VVLFWGLWNILDADFWALRAIAFLANVEAVYFYDEDTKVFNPYAGRHPPYTMIGSLKAQFIALMFLIGFAQMFFLVKVGERVGNNFARIPRRIPELSHLTIAHWLLPLVSFMILLAVTTWMRRRRLRGYLGFVQDCPGPGMVKDRTKFRRTDLISGNATENDVVPGAVLQERVRLALTAQVAAWDLWVRLTTAAAGVSVVATVALVVLKNRLF